MIITYFYVAALIMFLLAAIIESPRFSSVRLIAVGLVFITLAELWPKVR